jgi:hypothetical protein
MIQEGHSRLSGGQLTHSTETPRQRSGRAVQSVPFRLPESRSTERPHIAGQSLSLNSALQTRLTKIARATEELDRCVRERPNAHTLGDKWGLFLGEMDWQRELHNLLFEETQ